MVWVKICGVTTPEDAVFALECGADAVGLNFCPQSKRYLTDQQAGLIVAALPPGAEIVGVFVDTPTEIMAECSRRFRLGGIQTYRPLTVEERRSFATSVRVIPAFRVRDERSLNDISNVLPRTAADTLLLDSYVAGELGGTGQVAPWDLIAKTRLTLPVILAGGLTPETVADAIRAVRPWGVDVASGVESAPGRKDPGKVRAFVQAVRAASG